MQITIEGTVDRGPNSASTNDDNSIPRTSFRDHVSRFGYSNSSPAKKATKREPESLLPQIHSPALKRKRSQATKPKQISNLAPTETSAPATESPTPMRKATLRNRKMSSSPTTPLPSKLVDSLRPNLTLVLIGLNPGLTTASLGHPYSHPSNGFWKILYTSGITPIQHRPRDHTLLPSLYSIGNTNICARPSRLGSELTKGELAEGAKLLNEKIATYRPEAACVSGKGVWEALWSHKTGRKKMPKDGKGAFRYGWQEEELWLGRTVEVVTGEVVWKGAKTFVASSTSGLNAGMSPLEKEEAWRPLGEWMRRKREERWKKEEGRSGESWGRM